MPSRAQLTGLFSMSRGWIDGCWKEAAEPTLSNSTETLKLQESAELHRASSKHGCCLEPDWVTYHSLVSSDPHLWINHNDIKTCLILLNWVNIFDCVDLKKAITLSINMIIKNPSIHHACIHPSVLPSSLAAAELYHLCQETCALFEKLVNSKGQ